jgi:2,3-bisphosphoglycerate-independent phosphoglycerate mutase
MKYCILVADGMSDYPLKELGGRTPLEVAKTANMDFIAKNGVLGRAKTIPEGMSAASDVANLSILGYNPKEYYTGRGPLEAANLGIELEAQDVAFRCNLITASGDTLIDYSAGHISSAEAATLINLVNEKLGSVKISFYPGISYRNLMIAKEGAREGLENIVCKAPHDIAGQGISKNLPKGKNAQILINLMQESRKILPVHEVNMVRLDLKENPANMLWLWGQGRKPQMPKFREKYGLEGTVISAVDLLKGLGRILGLKVINVPGATGYYDTNYEGKAKAGLKALEKEDFVFVHLEAPDEAGHNGDIREKLTAIERFDSFIVGAFLKAFQHKRNFRILVLPDHPTPISLRTHTAEPVCFGIFGKDIVGRGFSSYCEKEAEKSQLYLKNGYELMQLLLKK